MKDDTYFRDTIYFLIICFLIFGYTCHLHVEHKTINQKLDQIIQVQTQINIEQK